MSYTQGPWEIGPQSGSVRPSSELVLTNGNVNGGYVICEVFGSDRAANAELIRAAPELADALRAILSGGVEMDDERIPYVVMQIDRDDIKAARELLATVPTIKEEA